MPTREQIVALQIGLRVSQLRILCNRAVNSSDALSSRTAALKYASRLSAAWRVACDTFRDANGHLQRGGRLIAACCDGLVDCVHEDATRTQVYDFCQSQLVVLLELVRANVLAGVVPEMRLGNWLDLGLELPRGEVPPLPFVPPKDYPSTTITVMPRSGQKEWCWDDEQRIGNLLHQVDLSRDDFLSRETGQDEPGCHPYDDSVPQGWGMFEVWLGQYEELIRYFPAGYEEALIRDRDFWIYQALFDMNRSLQTIIEDLEDEAQRHTPNWEHFTAPSHLLERGRLYAEAFNLAPPPRRQRGRPRQARN
jgi:hypothetical protein